MVHRMHLLLGRQIADPVFIQDARRRRCIVVSISVDVTNYKGWWECSKKQIYIPLVGSAMDAFLVVDAFLVGRHAREAR
jgi:hypothetical protein